jgi:hypothetical protein
VKKLLCSKMQRNRQFDENGLKTKIRAWSCLESYLKSPGHDDGMGLDEPRIQVATHEVFAKSLLPVMLLIWDADNKVFRDNLEMDMRGLAKTVESPAPNGTAGADQMYEIEIAGCKTSWGLFAKARAQLILQLCTVQRYLRLACVVPLSPLVSERCTTQ